MSNLDALLERNRVFAATDIRSSAPRAPYLPRRSLYIVTCIDPRTDPAAFLGLEYGEAIVARTAGGRVTPAVAVGVAYMSYLVETQAPEGPYFEVAIIHHTDCGTRLLEDARAAPSVRRALRRRREAPRRPAGHRSAGDGASRRGATAHRGGDLASDHGLRPRLRRRHRPRDDRRRGREAACVGARIGRGCGKAVTKVMRPGAPACRTPAQTSFRAEDRCQAPVLRVARRAVADRRFRLNPGWPGRPSPA